ncbi:hypothetical protein CHS0354_006033 [Potamilus streckersoni]|uniref:non-specific serine/threonine protein kinase n=1 Tax=Potamilus streckersoni TaxID=2493646 RepID=A0AAE0S384_9BIVA|nr:hypothetical protein CHS0354_006033 [Potamilus streckersoni]
METEAIPVGKNPDVSFRPESSVETRCLRELCGDGSAFMGLDDQSLLARLTEKDDDCFMDGDLDLKVSRSRDSFGSVGQNIDTIQHVNGEKISYISSKEFHPQLMVSTTSLELHTVVEKAIAMEKTTITVTAASSLSPPKSFENATTMMTSSSSTTPTITTVPTTLIASPIIMVSKMQAATNIVSIASITRQITVSSPVFEVSAMVSRTTSVPPTAMQGVIKERGDQYKSKKMEKLKVNTYIWTNAVDFNRKGAFGVSIVHLRAFKGKPGIPGMKSISTLNSAYLGEFAGKYQFGGQILRWVIKKDWPNGSLNTWLDKDPKRKFVDEDAARYITIRLIEAVQYLHSKGFYHGNIHPNNIYINDKGQSVLGDLSAAIKYDGMRSLRADKEYDFRFFSPELIRGPSMHRSSDIFSVGSVAFFVISGSISAHIGYILRCFNNISVITDQILPGHQVIE